MKKVSNYRNIVLQDVFPVSQLVEHWEELQDLATGVEDPYVKAQIAAEEEAIEIFFDDLGYGTVEEIADNPNGEAYQSELISGNYFEDYVREMIEDELPEIPAYVHIDWEGTARDIQLDYCSAELPLDAEIPNGAEVTFYMRAW